MTKYLAIAFLITGFLVGDAYGENRGKLNNCSSQVYPVSNDTSSYHHYFIPKLNLINPK